MGSISNKDDPHTDFSNYEIIKDKKDDDVDDKNEKITKLKNNSYKLCNCKCRKNNYKMKFYNPYFYNPYFFNLRNPYLLYPYNYDFLYFEGIDKRSQCRKGILFICTLNLLGTIICYNLQYKNKIY